MNKRVRMKDDYYMNLTRDREKIDDIEEKEKERELLNEKIEI